MNIAKAIDLLVRNEANLLLTLGPFQLRNLPCSDDNSHRLSAEHRHAFPGFVAQHAGSMSQSLTHENWMAYDCFREALKLFTVDPASSHSEAAGVRNLGAL